MLKTLILFVGLHSVLLGAALLFASGFTLELLGFPQAQAGFFSSQGGIFLVVLGVCYLLALRTPALVQVIVVSKALAVVFLLVHAAFLQAPKSVWGAAAGDAAMLVAVCTLVKREKAAGGGRPSGPA